MEKSKTKKLKKKTEKNNKPKSTLNIKKKPRVIKKATADKNYYLEHNTM